MAQLSTGHVFMSYSRRDEETMRRIVVFLRIQGIKVWVDNEKLVPGTPIWEEEIEKAIKGASAIVVVLSPDAKNSEWVRREISLADQYHKRIFPVLARGDEDASITLRLVTRQYVDIRQNEKTGLNSLSKALSLYLEELQTQEREALEKAEKLALEKAEAERKAQEETQQLAKQKEEVRLALEKAEAERKAKEEAERIAFLKAEEERLAREKAEAERKAREETERLAAQKAEEERISAEKAEVEREAARKKVEREAAEKAAKEKAEREAAEKAAKEKAQREAAEKAAKEKAERETTEKATKEKAEIEEAKKTVGEKVVEEKTEAEATDRIKVQPILVNQSLKGIQKVTTWKKIFYVLTALFFTAITGTLIGWFLFFRLQPIPNDLPVISIENIENVDRLITRNNLFFSGVRSIAFSPDGQVIATGSEDLAVRLWRVSDGQLLATLKSPVEKDRNSVYGLAFSPDGKTLATGSWFGTITIWQLGENKFLRSFEMPGGYLQCIEFSPDGSLLAAATPFSGDIVLWNFSDGTIQAEFKSKHIEGEGFDANGINNIAFSPDGTILASASNNKTINLWQLSNGTLIKTLQGHTGNVESVDFSPDGQSIVSGSGYDGTIRWWNVINGVSTKTLENWIGIGQATYSPDGTLIASTDVYGILLMQPSDTTPTKTITFAKNSFGYITFSPNGTLLATSSESGGSYTLWGVKP